MTNKVITIILAFMVLLTIITIASARVSISNDVLKELDINGSSNVIIKMSGQENSALTTTQLDIDVDRTYKDIVTAKINPGELNGLLKNNKVEYVRRQQTISASLQDAKKIINASITWPLKQNSTNLTGIDQTVCVIDTGINFAHPDLLGKNLTCIIDCLDKTCVQNCSVADDNGHGTHVAGTIAAYGNSTGIAPGAKLIGVKVLNSAGNGGSNAEVDLSNAIDWCVQNRLTYNITVISMSLGTTSYLNDTYCDSDFSSTWARSINNATGFNISVIAASGNLENTTHIASPACINNATAVGGTNKDDTVAFYSNTNSLVDLLAPGTNISATSSSGGYTTLQGTSMSTPQVAAAFAIIGQFYYLQTGIKYTPKQIENVLKSRGKNITASTGINISRINIYNATISLDSISPTINLVSPSNSSTSINTNQSFVCNASDLSLKNSTFYLYNSTNVTINQTSSSTTGATDTLTINISNMAGGTYHWNCQYTDENNNFALGTSNYTITVSNLSVILSTPQNNLFTASNQSFTCNATANNNLTNITFYIYNSTNISEYSNLTSTNGTSNSSTFYFNFTHEDDYKWNCLFLDTENTAAFSSNNYSIRYDLTSPQVTINSPSASSTITANNYLVNITLNEQGYCEYSLDGGLTNKTLTNLENTNTTFNRTETGVANGQYTIAAYCNDTIGHTNYTANSSFTISVTAATVSSGGGGGGGGGSSTSTYSPSNEQVISGYNNNLGTNDKIRFAAGDNEKHSLTINKVYTDRTNITINSSPINLIIRINESIKLNLSSEKFYDLLVRLNGIKNFKANITITKINEIIPQTPDNNYNNQSGNQSMKGREISAFNEEEKESNTFFEDYKQYIIAGIIAIAIIITFIIKTTRKSDKDIKREIN